VPVPFRLPRTSEGAAEPGPSLGVRRHASVSLRLCALWRVWPFTVGRCLRARGRPPATAGAERSEGSLVGSTSSVKTTFAGAFLNRISTMYPSDRIVTIEDTEELYCQSRSWLALRETDDVSQRDLLRTGMRARQDRLVIGEVRGPEAIDMVMSMNTSHSGFSTVHAGSIAGGLTRVRQLCRLGGEDTISPDRRDSVWITDAAVPNGPRTVSSLEKVCGLDYQIASDFVFAGQAAAITPDGLMSIGWNLSDAVCQVQNWNPIVNTALVIPQQFAGLALTLAYLLVAIEYLVVQVGAQFCIAVAGVAVGLLATRWTRPFSGVLPRVLFSTLILTVTIDAVAAVGVNFGNAMMAMIAAADTGSMSGMLNAFITITAAAAAYFVFAVGIPSLVGFLGATRPMPGGAAMMSSFARLVSRRMQRAEARPARGEGGRLGTADRPARSGNENSVSATLIGGRRNQPYINRGARSLKLVKSRQHI